MQKKTEKELLEYIKLKNKLESLNKNPIFEKKIKNPFDTLTFTETNNQEKKISSITSYKFWFLLLIASLLIVSVLFNSVISSKLDPFLYKTMNNLTNQISKPYVVTIGNFDTYASAKNKAIELLPKLRQIEIIQLPTKNYAFEIEKLSSKEKAYSVARDFKHDGFEFVNVRYLPGR